MRIVIIPRNKNGKYKDPISKQEYDLIEVEDGIKIATTKNITVNDSADDYAFSQGWNREYDEFPEPI